MRIAMISEHASPLAVLGGADAGGQNVHVAALAAALADRGHEVDVFTRRDDRALPAHVVMRPGVAVTHVDAGPPEPLPKDELLPYMAGFGRRLAEHLAVTPADVVHAHFWMSGVAALASGCDVPAVQTFHALGSVKRRHQGAADTSPANRVRWERTLARRATRVLAACSDERDEVRALGASPHRIDIVPSGVDLDRFTVAGPVARRTAAHRLVTVGRLVPRKGVDDAIRAVALVPDTELVVAGGSGPPGSAAFEDDAEVARLRQLAAGLGVADRVHLTGSVAHDEVAALLRSADAALCLPWYEPFGIVPLEAMACGVPVIGSAVGGLLDTVADGVTGVLVPPRDPRSAARAARRIVGSPGVAARLGRAGALRAARYTWPAVAELAEHAYLSARGVPRRPATEVVAG